MSDYKELPCRRCGHVWKWARDKKTIPYCPEGYGCREKELDYQMTLTYMDYVRGAIANAMVEDMSLKDLYACAEHAQTAKDFDNAVNLFAQMLESK